MSRKTSPIHLDTIAVGDLVTSRWSSNGAIWRVTSVGEIEKPYARSAERRWLELKSVQSNRTDKRTTWDLELVVEQ